MVRLLIIIPFLTVLAVFFLMNMQPPYPIDFVIMKRDISIGMLAFVLGLASFALGALTVFISWGKQWRRAKKAEQNARSLEEQLNALRGQYIALSQQNIAAASVQGGVNGVSNYAAKPVMNAGTTVEPAPVPTPVPAPVTVNENNESKG